MPLLRGVCNPLYGASEGLKTVVVERWAVGGQAASSPKIENYRGFPKGISGGELAERAREQACRFGAEIPTPASRGTSRAVRPEGDSETRGMVTGPPDCVRYGSTVSLHFTTRRTCLTLQGTGLGHAHFFQRLPWHAAR
jgi:hypothetical protein